MRFVPIVCVLSTPKIEIIDHAQKDSRKCYVQQMTQNYEPGKMLRTLLLRWQSGELNERQVHEEAERIWAQR